MLSESDWSIVFYNNNILLHRWLSFYSNQVIAVIAVVRRVLFSLNLQVVNQSLFILVIGERERSCQVA